MGAAATRAFGNADRLASPTDWADRTTSYRYRPDGSLAVISSDNGASTYGHNGDGKRSSKTVGATTTSYAYDPNQSLPVVLTDDTLRYVYGNGLAYVVDNSGNVEVCHTAGVYSLGSVRAITNGAGSVTATYQTDEFGIPTVTQGGNTLPFQFTGQQQDAESSFSYLQARYYDPATGRFLSRDPVHDSISPRRTLNPYTYAGNNPATLTDPSGKCLPACLVVGLYVVGVGVSAVQTAQTFLDPDAGLKTKLLSVGLLVASLDPQGGVVEGAGDVVIAREEAAEETPVALEARQTLTSMANDLLQSLPAEMRKATVAAGRNAQGEIGTPSTIDQWRANRPPSISRGPED